MPQKYLQLNDSDGIGPVVAKDMGIDHSMNFMTDAVGSKAMFKKEKFSRSALYEKLAGGISFSKTKSEDDFVNED
jgi:hypothetical protein